MNPRVLIIHGSRESGKTSRAEEAVERGRESGYNVNGVLSLRDIKDGETVGYNGVNVRTGTIFPLAKKEADNSYDWHTFGDLIYSFSTHGFRRANKILEEASEEMDDRTLVVADEYGHLEIQGRGIYPGLKTVVDSLDNGGCLIVTCRTDKLTYLINLLSAQRPRILLRKADSAGFWESLGDYFI